MKRVFGIVIAGCAAILLCSPARASTTYSISPVTVNASPGDTGDAFEVDLTNDGPDAISVAAFNFEVTVADTDITLTGADFSTVLYNYIFAGDSFDQTNSLTLDFPGPDTTAQTLQASDSTNDLTGITINSGVSLALGEVYFDVSPTAATGPFAISFTGTPTPGDANNLSDASFAPITVDNYVGGSINVGSSTPEPSPVFLMLAGMALLLGLRARAR